MGWETISYRKCTCRCYTGCSTCAAFLWWSASGLPVMSLASQGCFWKLWREILGKYHPMHITALHRLFWNSQVNVWFCLWSWWHEFPLCKCGGVQQGGYTSLHPPPQNSNHPQTTAGGWAFASVAHCHFLPTCSTVIFPQAAWTLYHIFCCPNHLVLVSPVNIDHLFFWIPRMSLSITCGILEKFKYINLYNNFVQLFELPRFHVLWVIG